MTAGQPDHDDEDDPPAPRDVRATAAGAAEDASEPVDDEVADVSGGTARFQRGRARTTAPLTASNTEARGACVRFPESMVGAEAFEQLAKISGLSDQRAHLVLSDVREMDAVGAVTLGAMMYSHLRPDHSHSVELWEPDDPACWPLVGSLVGPPPDRAQWFGLRTSPARLRSVAVPSLRLDPELAEAMERGGLLPAVLAAGAPTRVAQPLRMFLGEFASNTRTYGRFPAVMAVSRQNTTGTTTLAYWDSGPGLGGFSDPVAFVEEMTSSDATGSLVDLPRLLSGRTDLRMGLASSIARGHFDGNTWIANGPRAAIPGFAVCVSIRE